jgi:hypothetical protein
LDSARVHGTVASGAASALSATNAIAASSAIAPRERGQASLGSKMPRTSRKPPQPMNAAAWLKKVAEGGTLNAISVGSATATTAHETTSGPGACRSIVATSGAGASAEDVCASHRDQ